jgi:hypothetical protein
MAFAYVGVSCLQTVQQYRAKQEMNARILAGVNDEELLAISETDAITWKEAGKEFLLNGNLYDVVRIKHTNSGRLLLCVTDEQEGRILKKFENFAHEQQKKGSEKSQLTLKLSVPQLPSVQPLVSSVMLTEPVKNGWPYHALCTGVCTIVLPPPKC